VALGNNLVSTDLKRESPNCIFKGTTCLKYFTTLSFSNSLLIDVKYVEEL